MEGINAKRVELFTATAHVRSIDVSQATLRTDGFELVGARKRGRAPSLTPKQPTAKRVRRPSAIATAAKDSSQTRIQISCSQINSSQAINTLESHMADAVDLTDINDSSLIDSSQNEL